MSIRCTQRHAEDKQQIGRLFGTWLTEAALPYNYSHKRQGKDAKYRPFLASIQSRFKVDWTVGTFI